MFIADGNAKMGLTLIDMSYVAQSHQRHILAGRLYHNDSQDTLLRWRLEGDQHSDSDEEDERDMVVDANDLNQHEELLERYISMHACKPPVI